MLSEPVVEKAVLQGFESGLEAARSPLTASLSLITLSMSKGKNASEETAGESNRLSEIQQVARMFAGGADKK